MHFFKGNSIWIHRAHILYTNYLFSMKAIPEPRGTNIFLKYCFWYHSADASVPFDSFSFAMGSNLIWNPAGVLAPLPSSAKLRTVKWTNSKGIYILWTHVKDTCLGKDKFILVLNFGKTAMNLHILVAWH